MIFSTLSCPHMTWGPQILCNQKGTQPLMGQDRSRILDLNRGIIWLMIFHFLCHIDYNGFKEFIKDWPGPNLYNGFNYVQHYFYILLFIEYLYVILRVLNLLCKFLPFMYIILYILLYSVSLYILSCTVHMLHPLSYTSLLANVVFFIYDFK